MVSSRVHCAALSNRLADVILLHLYHSEIQIHEIGLSSAIDSTSPLTFQQLKSVCACNEAIKSWFEVFFSIPISAYIAFPSPIFTQLMTCLITLYRILTFDNPAWDKDAARQTADLIPIFDRVLANGEQAPKALGLDNSGSLDGDVFTRSVKMLRTLRPAWEAKLRRNNPVAADAPTPQSNEDILLADSLPTDFSDNDWLMDMLIPSTFQ